VRIPQHYIRVHPTLDRPNAVVEARSFRWRGGHGGKGEAPVESVVERLLRFEQDVARFDYWVVGLK
jgi:hypothetical protein